MSITVRTIGAAEIDDWARALELGFNTLPHEQDRAYRHKYLQVDRALGAFADDGELVGTTYAYPTPLTLPGGGSVVASAVTAVAVVPTHRRRGALTEMVRVHLDGAAERGEPAAVLIAAEAPIYGRYGYGAATRHAAIEVDTGRTRLLEPRRDNGIRVRFVDRDEFRAAAPDVFDRVRLDHPGEIGRDGRHWDVLTGVITRSWNEEAAKRQHLLAEGGDGPVGALAYRVHEGWAGRLPAGTATIDMLLAPGIDEYVALWDHLLRLDWITRIEAKDRPETELLQLLVNDSRRVQVTMVSDFLWSRLLDVTACLAARSYSTPDRLVLEVVDRFRPASGGRFALDGGPTGASCQPSDDPADLTVHSADLAAAWLGGTPLWWPARAGRATEHTDGALRRFDAMFLSQPPPFCSTWF